MSIIMRTSAYRSRGETWFYVTCKAVAAGRLKRGLELLLMMFHEMARSKHPQGRRSLPTLA
jgi:hypothetical protein